MYIYVNNREFPCVCAPQNGNMIYRGLPGDFVFPFAGVVRLYSNDGFLLRSDDPADYARVSFAGDTLTMSNMPEEQPPTDKDRISALESKTSDMQAVIDTMLGGEEA